MAGKRYYDVGFCKYRISQEGNVAGLLHIIYKKCIRQSFASSIYYGPWLGPRKNFQNFLIRLENAILRLFFANTVNTFFN